MIPNIYAALAALVWICCAAAPGAVAAPAAQAPTPRFAMSVQPLYALCVEIAGPSDCARILPPGISPHTYEPRPSDLKRAAQSKALFYVSPLLDAWAQRLDAPAHIALIESLPAPFRLAASHRPHHHDDGAEQLHAAADARKIVTMPGAPVAAAIDPHFWLDPLAAKALVPILAQKFCALSPHDCRRYEAAVAPLEARLSVLDAELAKSLSAVKDVAFLVYHPFMDYLAHRYGLRLVGHFEPFPGKEPTPKYLKHIIDTARRTKAKVIFTSPEIASGAAHAVAEAAGIPVVVLDDLGGSPGRESYADMMRYNAATLVKALQ